MVDSSLYQTLNSSGWWLFSSVMWGDIYLVDRWLASHQLPIPSQPHRLFIWQHHSEEPPACCWHPSWMSDILTQALFMIAAMLRPLQQQSVQWDPPDLLSSWVGVSSQCHNLCVHYQVLVTVLTILQFFWMLVQPTTMMCDWTNPAFLICLILLLPLLEFPQAADTKCRETISTALFLISKLLRLMDDFCATSMSQHSNGWVWQSSWQLIKGIPCHDDRLPSLAGSFSCWWSCDASFICCCLCLGCKNCKLNFSWLTWSWPQWPISGLMAVSVDNSSCKTTI